MLKLLGWNNNDANRGRIMINNQMGKGLVARRKQKTRYGRTKEHCVTQSHFGFTRQ